MRIDRWNGNTLRRYHLGGGAIAGVIRIPGKPRRCFMIAASLPCVATGVPDSWVLDYLRRARRKEPRA